MPSYQITEDLVEDQVYQTDPNVDSDSDDSEAGDIRSPEPEDLNPGPSTGFTERGKQKADSSGVPKDNRTSNKDQNNVPVQQISRPQTKIPPPKRDPKPATYSGTGK
ncbi:hypothetical protein BD769DRAFT_1663368 [Suillus cothurnatus]|jgi:hypothetical protein|nr:hypothetical protein BD769DRAFT_1663368 [Suillus cothurnatus]